MSQEKKLKQRGGRRPGAGRKPCYLKKLGLRPINAAQILAHFDEVKLWTSLLNDRSADVRARALMYLVDRRDGKSTAALRLSGGLMTAHFDAGLEGLADRLSRAREMTDAELSDRLRQLESELGLAKVVDAPPSLTAPPQRAQEPEGPQAVHHTAAAN